MRLTTYLTDFDNCSAGGGYLCLYVLLNGTCTREGFDAECVNLVNKFGAICGAYICVHVYHTYCSCVCMYTNVRKREE